MTWIEQPVSALANNNLKKSSQISTTGLVLVMQALLPLSHERKKANIETDTQTDRLLIYPCLSIATANSSITYSDMEMSLLQYTSEWDHYHVWSDVIYTPLEVFGRSYWDWLKECHISLHLGCTYWSWCVCVL